MFDAMLLAPLPQNGQPRIAPRRAATPMQVEDEMADFASLYAQVNGGRAR